MVSAAVIPLAGIVCGTMLLMGTLIHVSSHIAERRRLNARAALPNDVSDRLERIEQMVESMTIEMERLGESNRFVTRLLSEKSEAAR